MGSDFKDGIFVHHNNIMFHLRGACIRNNTKHTGAKERGEGVHRASSSSSSFGVSHVEVTKLRVITRNNTPKTYLQVRYYGSMSFLLNYYYVENITIERMDQHVLPAVTDESSSVVYLSVSQTRQQQ